LVEPTGAKWRHLVRLSIVAGAQDERTASGA
ncbi:MAG: hypothetical protein ACI9HE_003232, partial [Planctomycetota bacterium]